MKMRIVIKLYFQTTIYNIDNILNIFKILVKHKPLEEVICNSFSHSIGSQTPNKFDKKITSISGCKFQKIVSIQ
jgi:hypothetical protein